MDKRTKGVAIVNYLAYADDICIFAVDLKTLVKKFQILLDVFGDFGLTCNLAKTCTITYNWRLGKARSALTTRKASAK